jgi:cell division septum initiation protein DivIVA
MELTLKRLLENAEFKKYRGKGYDPTEVQDFIDKAAAMAAKVEVQLTQAMEQAKGAGGASPADIEAEVERRVAEHVAQLPPPAAGPSEDETAEQVRRTIVMAQRTADAAIAEAREDADKIVAAAREQAEALVGDAQAHAEAQRAETDAYVASTRADVEAEAARERRDARQRLAAEIGELEGVREMLRADVSILERHVEEQRSQLGSTLAELQQILDDPSGFRMAPAPALAEPDLPDFADLAAPTPEPEPVAPAPGPAAAADDAPAEVDEVAPIDEAPVDATAPEAPDAAAATAADGPAVERSFGRIPDPVEARPEAEEPAGRGAPAPPPTLTFGEVDHEAPGIDDPRDSGPPTAPVSAVELGVEPSGDDDAFLAELRKAMADDEPLGPRDQADPSGPDPLFEDEDRRGWRFGRRR